MEKLFGRVLYAGEICFRNDRFAYIVIGDASSCRKQLRNRDYANQSGNKTRRASSH